MDLLRVVATPHNTVIDAQMWSPNYDAEPLIQHKFVKKLNYQTEGRSTPSIVSCDISWAIWR